MRKNKPRYRIRWSEIGNFNFLKTLNEIKVKKVFNDRGIKQISNLIIKSDFPFGVIKTKRSIEIKQNICLS